MIINNIFSAEWTVGPVPIEDRIGKEVISKITSDLNTGLLPFIYPYARYFPV